MQGDDDAHLRELGDPDFITHWAALRNRLFFISRKEPEYPEIKYQYDTVKAEYRRRMRGGLAEEKKRLRKE